MAPGFWDSPRQAQKDMRYLAKLKATVELWQALEMQTASLLDLVELASEEGETSLEDQLTKEIDQIAHTLANEEVNLTLSGPYDDRGAIVSIYSGAGGVDSQDWAQMLLRMYTRWAEQPQIKAQILDVSYGDEAGIKSATLEIVGHYVYGYLMAEKGVHRLVRLSPFDSNHLRHTSFAMVEVMPVAEDDPDIMIRTEDLKMDVFRSSGPGGQNVQKVASAVRITHTPTGIVVSCQTERSQYQNREYAMKILRARLLERALEERAKEVAVLKGKHVSVEWGNQIRSYVLHPYQMVKDHRTNLETSDTEGVLDGQLEEFIKGYLLWKV